MLIALIINYLCSFAALVCWIIVVVAMFRLGEAVWKRVLAIVFPPWGFVWGWMTRESTGLRKVMILWTVFMVGAAISGMISAPYLAAG